MATVALSSSISAQASSDTLLNTDFNHNEDVCLRMYCSSSKAPNNRVIAYTRGTNLDDKKHYMKLITQIQKQSSAIISENNAAGNVAKNASKECYDNYASSDVAYKTLHKAYLKKSSTSTSDFCTPCNKILYL